jgi:glutathione S-transferase
MAPCHQPEPNLCAYVARAEARPAYKRAFDDQLAVFTASSSTDW